MSFDEAAATFEVVTGMADVNAKQVERVAKQLGAKVAAASLTVTAPTQPVAAVMHMEIDGTGVPMRPEATTCRVGKATDGGRVRIYVYG